MVWWHACGGKSGSRLYTSTHVELSCWDMYALRTCTYSVNYLHVHVHLLQDVIELIRIALLKYSADRIAKFDFALHNSGGCVVQSSETYPPALETYSVMGVPVWTVPSSPKIIIQVWLMFVFPHCIHFTYSPLYCNTCTVALFECIANWLHLRDFRENTHMHVYAFALFIYNYCEKGNV